jgi:hypothetical protein|tara:strand:- start:218 stop:331 length:114 start_codon:yes stop_codon:yes gene_type:complete
MRRAEEKISVPTKPILAMDRIFVIILTIDKVSVKASL